MSIHDYLTDAQIEKITNILQSCCDTAASHDRDERRRIGDG